MDVIGISGSSLVFMTQLISVKCLFCFSTVENGTSTENKSLSKFFKAVNADMQCSNDEVIELIHLSDEEDSGDVCSSPKKSVYKRTFNCQNEVKTLILFEDVDATLSEDHGFITTIQQLAVTAKRPMILTSNSKNSY